MAFIFDRDILEALPRQDRRVEFIRESLVALDNALRQHGSGLIVRHGRPRDAIPALARELGATAVYCNRDYEPAAQLRDRDVATTLALSGIALHSYKDQAIFEQDELLTQSGKPFTVFTPYKNAWYKGGSSIRHGLFYSALSGGALPAASGAITPGRRGPDSGGPRFRND